MNVLPIFKSLNHIFFFAQRSDDPQFDLRVICSKQYVFLVFWNKGSAHLFASFGTDGDVLQIGVVGAQSSGGGYCLSKSRMDSFCLCVYLIGQGVYIRTLEFDQATPFDDFFDDVM